jgi:hypothetical protein
MSGPFKMKGYSYPETSPLKQKASGKTGIREEIKSFSKSYKRTEQAKKTKMLKGTTVFGKTIPEIKQSFKNLLLKTPTGRLYKKLKQTTKKRMMTKDLKSKISDKKMSDYMSKKRTGKMLKGSKKLKKTTSSSKGTWGKPITDAEGNIIN